MSYEIPQQLEYKERIAFGLTLSQLLIALGFVIPSVATFIFLGAMGVSLIARLLSLVPFVGLAIGFMFFDLGSRIKDIMAFSKFRYDVIYSQKMKDYIGLKKIDENVIQTNVKGRIAILKIEPINLSIKTEEVKQAIDVGFQKFLNAIDFPMQILINTTNIDFEKCFPAKSKEFSEDFIKHLKEHTGENKLRNRNFYLVVIEKNAGLDVQVDLCRQMMQNIGLRAERLVDEELVQFLLEFFNDQNKKRDVPTDIMNIDPTYYLIAPMNIENNSNHIKVNEKFCRVIAAVGYPRKVEFGFLDKIISAKGDFDVTIHIDPFPIEKMMIMLNKELQKQRADLYALELRKAASPSLEIQYQDTRNTLENLQKGEEKLFHVSLYITCKADSLEKLNFLTKKVESDLNAILIIPKTPLFKQAQAYRSTIPFGKDDLGIKRNITTRALSAFFPFTSQFLSFDRKGIFLGLNKNQLPIIKDPFLLTNPNGIILATSGGGKSYFAKLMISRLAAHGTKVFIIDPQGEYVDLTYKYQGEVIEISSKSKTMINPLDLMGHDYVEKRLSLQGLFSVIFPDLSEPQRAILDRVVNDVYSKHGIRKDMSNTDEKVVAMPRLHHLYMKLLSLQENVTEREKPVYLALTNRLAMYVTGVFSFFNKQTNLNFSKDVVCFDISKVSRYVKPVIMYLILDFVLMRMTKDRERKMLVLDEAWSVLAKNDAAEYVFEIVKTSRKFNLGLLMITQEVADLVASKAGHAALANSSYTLLLRQKPSIIQSVVKTFNLSDPERDLLLTAPVGKGILVMENDHQQIEIIASPQEHKLITTNPEELKKKVPTQLEQSVFLPNLPKPKLLKANELSRSQINAYINRGYAFRDFRPLGEKARQQFLILPCRGESLAHTFVVDALEQYIRRYTSVIKVCQAREPDIVFLCRNQEYAIEIETPLSLRKKKGHLKAKAARLNEEYGDRWFIVPTQSKYAYYFSKFGRVVTRTNICQHVSALFSQQASVYVTARANGQKVELGSKTFKSASVSEMQPAMITETIQGV